MVIYVFCSIKHIIYASVLFSFIYTEWIQGIRVSQTVPVTAETIPK